MKPLSFTMADVTCTLDPESMRWECTDKIIETVLNFEAEEFIANQYGGMPNVAERLFYRTAAAWNADQISEETLPPEESDPDAIY